MGIIKEACNSTESPLRVVLDTLSQDVLEEVDIRAAVVAIKRIGEVLKSIPVMITSKEAMKGFAKKQS